MMTAEQTAVVAPTFPARGPLPAGYFYPSSHHQWDGYLLTRNKHSVHLPNKQGVSVCALDMAKGTSRLSGSPRPDRGA